LGIAPDVLAELARDRGQQHEVYAGREMLASAGQHHDTHGIGGIDPVEDLDDLAPEIGIHRIDLVRTVDLHMGDLIRQLYAKGLVVGHGTHPRPLVWRHSIYLRSITEQL